MRGFWLVLFMDGSALQPTICIDFCNLNSSLLIWYDTAAGRSSSALIYHHYHRHLCFYLQFIPRVPPHPNYPHYIIIITSVDNLLIKLSKFLIYFLPFFLRPILPSFQFYIYIKVKWVFVPGFDFWFIYKIFGWESK